MNRALETFGSKTVAAAQLARQLVAQLGPEAADEKWLVAESQVREVKAFAAELAVAFGEAFTDRLKAGDIDLGDGRRFYAGKVTKTAARLTPGEAFEALLEALGGDVDTLKDFLSSGWCKYGEVKGRLPELFDQLYEVTETLDAKTGATKRQARLTR